MQRDGRWGLGQLGAGSGTDARNGKRGRGPSGALDAQDVLSGIGRRSDVYLVKSADGGGESNPAIAPVIKI